MQLNSTTELSTFSKKRQKITIKRNNHLTIQQQFHAAAINLIPLFGTIVAVVIALQSGINPVEIELLVSMYTLTLLGISVGFHRHFAHCSFQTNIIMRVILAILGSMACQGSVIYWVSNHRRHHQYSDQPEDPHSPYFDGSKSLSPLQGLWHAQIDWTFTHEITNTFFFAKDLLRDPLISQVSNLYYLWSLLGLLIPSLLGGILIGNSMGLLSGFLWGGCVRLFLSYHFTNSINSITHLYGSRPFDTQELSTNNIWLVITTVGEGWHNNHHAFPNSAKFGLEWWQIDLGYWVIRVLEVVGLVWDVRTPTLKMIETKKSI